MAEYLARGRTGSDESAPPPPEVRLLPSVRPRLRFPYRSPFHRGVRLVGMIALLCSALGLLASVAGMPLNPLSMLGALLLSLVLIGYSVRPSLRKPRF